MKRLLSLALSITILLNTLSGQSFLAYALDELTTGQCGDNVYYSFDSSTGVLEINGSGNMWNYYSMGSPFYSNCMILTVNISSKVTSIGDYAFSECRELRNVVIPSDIKTIGSYSFYLCDKLTKLILPNGVTNIGDSAFSYCTSITSLIIPDSVITIENNAFGDCKNISSVAIGKGVAKIESGTFDSCVRLTSVLLSENLTNIDDEAFMNNSNLSRVFYSGSKEKWEKIQIGIDNKNITEASINYNCEFGTCGENVIYAFDLSTGVVFICGIGAITDYLMLRSPFCLNNNIKSVFIDNGITHIGDYLFDNCRELTSISLPTSLIGIGDFAFQSCERLSRITIPYNLEKIGKGAFASCKSITSLVIPNGVTAIYNSTFQNCESLIDISIGDNVNSIGDYAFKGCNKLLDVSIPDSVTYIGNWAFAECVSLTNVLIPRNITQIGNYAFRNCTSLDSINVDSDNQYYSSINGVLFDKNRNTLIQYPIGNGRISYSVPDTVTSIKDTAFFQNKYLETIELPKSVTNIDSDSFAYCLNLNSIIVDEGNIFYSDLNGVLFNKEKTILVQYPIGNTNSNYIVPKTVERINDYAFMNCTNISSIVFQDNLCEIGAYAFYYCSSLLYVNYSGSEDEWKNIEIEYGNEQISIADITFDFILYHEHEYEISIREPSCEESGFSTYKCTICNYSFTTDVTPPLGHAFTAKIIEPTCVTQGFTTFTCSVCDYSYLGDYTDLAEHKWDSGRITQIATCTEPGEKQYICEICEESKCETIPTENHVIITQLTPATPGMNGSVVTRCSNCNTELSRSVIYCPQTVTLSATKYTYDGKEKKPSVKVTDSNGKTISASNYSVTYASGRKAVGRYSVKLDFKGNYSGSITKTFDIVPKATSLKSVKSVKKKAIQLVWSKVAGVSGYEIQLATDKSFKKEIKSYTAESKYTKGNINNLKGGKKYYVRIRAFKTVKYGGKNVKIYSSWSKAKSAKTKK